MMTTGATAGKASGAKSSPFPPGSPSTKLGAKTKAPPKKKVRRKKPPTSTAASSKPPSTLNYEATIAAATRAKIDLNEARAEAEARKSDAAWLSPDMISVALSHQEKAGFLQKEGEILKRALEKNGLTREELTTEAFGCLLEHSRRYACSLLMDAQDYAWHSSRKEITTCDLKLAAEMRDDFTVDSILPSRDDMLALAEEVNKVPLPHIPPKCYHGVVLPRKDLMITARTFDVVSTDDLDNKNQGSSKESEKDDDVSKKKSGDGSYGANKGRQIPIKMKTAKDTLQKEGVGMAPNQGQESNSGTSVEATPAPSSSFVSSAVTNSMVSAATPMTGVLSATDTSTNPVALI